MAFFREQTDKRMKPKCIMCEGDMDTTSYSSICNACRDKMRKNA